MLLIAVAVTVPIAGPAFAAPGTLSKWKFDETTQGATAADEAGLNDGTPGFTGGLAAPVPSTDVAPVAYTNVRSLAFDGQNYIQVDNPVSTDFSICAWVRTSSAGGGTNHWESAPIFDAEYGGVNYDFGFGIGAGGRLIYGNGGLDADGNLYDMQVNGATLINDDAWHNVCVTRDNSNGAVNLYVDAIVDGSGTTGMGALTVNGSARIGWGYDGAASYDGLIDELTIYDGVLTPTQVANISAGSEDPDVEPYRPPVAITAPAAGSTTGTWAPVVDWADSVTCEYSYDSLTWTAATCADDGADIPAPTTDGSHQLFVRGALSGYAYGATDLTFTYDATAPTVDAGTGLHSNAPVDISGATAGDATSSFTTEWTQVSGPGTVTLTDPSTMTPTVSGVSEDGTYVLRLTVTDAAGNTSSDEIELVWDTTAPAIDRTSTHSSLTNRTTAEFTFAVTELLSEPSVVMCSLDGGAFVTCTSPDTHTGLLDGDHTWTLRATDDLGNARTTSVSWTVDTVAPLLTRVGAATVDVAAGTTYDDPGATAVDTREGDLTSSVRRTGQVQTDTPGSYRLTYQVTDAAGNAAVPVSRTVTVLATAVDTATATCRGLTPTVVATAGVTTRGTAGDDVILGTSGDDTILAGGGDDVICGLGGDDILKGQRGDDVLRAGTGDDRVLAGRGKDTLDGGQGNDRLTGGQGNDTIVTGSGNDSARAGAGNDLLQGRRGNDVLRGGPGDDRVLAGPGTDTVIGNRGDDDLHGGRGNDRMRGSQDDDRVSGDQGDDDLTGGAGLDRVRGGQGADTVTPEPGENQHG